MTSPPTTLIRQYDSTRWTPVYLAAQAYAEDDWPVLPVNASTKKPLTKWRLGNESQRASVDGRVVHEWFSKRFPAAAVAVETGAPSGLFVLDVDGEAGAASLAALTAEHGPLPATLTALTPSGGRHYFFAYSGGKTQAGVLGTGLDTRGDGGYVVVAPSARPDGKAYAWVDAAALPAPAPAWLLALCGASWPDADPAPDAVRQVRIPPGEYAEKAFADEVATLRGTAAGGRNAALNLAAYNAGRLVSTGHLNEAAARDRLTAAALAVGLAPDETATTLESGMSRGKAKPLTLVTHTDVDAPIWPAQTWDDFGNAERLVVRYADRLRWVGDNEKWATYEGDTGLWLPRGAEHRATGLARKTVERMGGEEAMNYSPEPGSGKNGRSQRDDWRAWVRTCRSTARVSSLLAQAKSKRALHASINDFDVNPALLHCSNGVLDLTTYELHDHSPHWLCTITTGTDYLPGATCPTWQSYLDLFLPEPDLREYVQRVIGYSLLDGNPERLFFFVCGGTSTGKSTLNEIALATFGGYAKPFNLSIFRANQDEKPRSDIAGVLPRRYISAVEASNEWHLHGDQIKKITGGDTLAARFPWDRTDTVRTPGFVPFIFTNAIPSIEGRDRALDRRLYVIPFEHEVPAAKDERRAREQMTASPVTRSAFLGWAVEGLRKYQADGLGDVPAVVLEATSGARREFSDLDRFLADRCDFEEGNRCRPDDLYAAYEDWCVRTRIKERDTLTVTKFGKGIKARGHERKRAKEGGVPHWFYVGLALKSATSQASSVTSTTGLRAVK